MKELVLIKPVQTRCAERNNIDRLIDKVNSMTAEELTLFISCEVQELKEDKTQCTARPYISRNA